MDDFKRNIKGFRGGKRCGGNGRSCPCCREVSVAASRKLARHRLRDQALQEIADASRADAER